MFTTVVRFIARMAGHEVVRIPNTVCSDGRTVVEIIFPDGETVVGEKGPNEGAKFLALAETIVPPGSIVANAAKLARGEPL